MTDPTLDPAIVGDVIGGRYQLTERLGEGGMGVLYLAFDQRAANRRVVIKFPKKNLLFTEGFKSRFDQEIKQLISFEHPNVVRVYDVGAYNDSPFMVLQYLAGGSLADRIAKDGLRAPTEMLRWLPRIAGALDSLHRQGIIHRDIKAANILFDSHGEAYLSDFGIVKVLTDLESQGTLTGSGMGSPESLAPEYIHRNFSGAYDQYGLATTVYQAVAGRLPFEARNADELQILIVTEPPCPLVNCAPNVGNRFADVVMKALSKKPSQRYITCAEFVVALQAALSDKSGGNGVPPSHESAILEVRSNVTGASVAIDEKVVGAAPAIVRLPKGTYNLRVSSRGFRPFEASVDLIDDRSIIANLELQRPRRIARYIAGFVALAVLGVIIVRAIVIAPSPRAVPPVGFAPPAAPPTDPVSIALADSEAAASAAAAAAAAPSLDIPASTRTPETSNPSKRTPKTTDASELMAFKAAVGTHTSSAYRAYLMEFSNGTHAADVRQRMRGCKNTEHSTQRAHQEPIEATEYADHTSEAGEAGRRASAEIRAECEDAMRQDRNAVQGSLGIAGINEKWHYIDDIHTSELTAIGACTWSQNVTEVVEQCP